MREAGRIKEKIEIVLDSRQVVALVLGSSVVLGIVFYLGVTVGRDLAAESQVEAVDTLERLDRQALVIDDKLTFQEALTEPAPARPAAEPKKAEPKKAEPKVEKKEEQRQEAAPAQRAEAPVPQPEEKPAETPRTETAAAEPKVEAEGPYFSVQVGALPTQPEAEALVARLRQQGLSPYVVESEVPGKGHFFRVRIGRFRTRDEAKRYLEDLQRESGLSGFVAQVDG